MSDIDYERLYEDVIPSVVSVYRDAGRGGAGSGFVYDATHVVTNEHVVNGVEEVDLRFSGGEWRTGRVVGSDAYTDLVVVAVEDLPADAEPLSLATADPAPGRPVAALGNPLGLDGSITAGIVSGANRSMGSSGGFAIPAVVQTDAAINPGNSGGPLVAAAGDGYEVVGVNRAKAGDNVGFAVAPSVVARVVPALVETGGYRHAYLRVRTLDVTPRIAEANGLDGPRGVLVVEAPAGSGLRRCTDRRRVRGVDLPVGGDVIVGIDDEEVRSHEELMRHLVVAARPGEPVELAVLRDGERTTVVVTPGERPRVEGGRRRGRRGERGGQRGDRGSNGGAHVPVE